MSEETAREVQQLLTPTDDVNRWLRGVRALNKDETLPLLVEILKDGKKTPRDRLQAALILGYLHDQRAIGVLIEMLQTPNPVLRAQAAESLGLIGVPEETAVQSLMQGLNDEDYFVRECSAKALGELKRPEAIPQLERMSATDNVESNREVAQRVIQLLQGIP